MDWTNILKLAAGTGLQLYGSEVTASGYEIAADQAVAGGNYTASIYRSSGLATIAMANYNNKVVDANKNTAIKAVATQMNSIYTSNVATQASTGISLSSRSYMAVANATISKGEQDIVAIKNNAEQVKANTLYQAQLQQTAFENQARAAEYQGALDAANQEYKAGITRAQSYGKAVSGLARGATTLLGKK